MHGLIRSEGFSQFYDLKAGQTLPPVKSLAFQNRDYQWLRDLTAKAEEGCVECGETPHATLSVQGISCAACVWLIERIFRRHDGGLRIIVDAQLGQMRIWWDRGGFDAVAFAEELQHFGYATGLPERQAEAERLESRALLTRLGVVGGLAMNAMAFTLPRYAGMEDGFALGRLFDLVTFASASLALLVGGGYFFKRAWQAVMLGTLHIDLPISIGLLAAYFGSLAGWLLGVKSLMYFDFVAIFSFLMLGGRWVQQTALEKNRAALLQGRDRIKNVTRISGGGEVESVPAGDIEPDDRIRLGSGETVPVSGLLESDSAEFSFEWINGEPEPRVIELGGEVPAGAVNVGRNPVEMKCREKYADSLLARLLAVSESGPGEGKAARDLSNVLRWYLGIILGIAAVGGGAWLIAGAGFAVALQVVISVLVVSCPCALGVALPLLDEIVMAQLKKSGLFVQNASLWAKLRRLGTIVFDKTGTLTLETPKLKNPEAIDALVDRERAILASLVHDSRHPAGRAIREALAGRSARSLAGPLVIEEEVAHGVRWTEPDSGTVWSYGKPGWKSAATDGDTASVFSRGGETLAGFRFEEALREDAGEEIALLRNHGYRVAILSGDARERVARIAGRLGIHPRDTVAEAGPEQKADWILSHQPDRTLYVGDGANDSLAFDAAACRGTPAIGSGVLERKSDFYFLGQGLHAIRKLIELTSRRRRAIHLIFAAAIFYNIFAVVVALAGRMNPLVAAILMPISSVVTLLIAATAGRERSRRQL